MILGFFEILLDRPAGSNRIMGMINENNCYVCNSYATDDAGYLMLSVEGKTTRLHRLIYQRLNGVIPDGMEVRHLCHNKKCCNPDHLAVGTHQENMDDNKLNGHKHKNKTLLRLSDKRRIIKNKTITNQELAEKYNVPVRTIYKIKQDAKNGKVFTSKDKPSIPNKGRVNRKVPYRK